MKRFIILKNSLKSSALNEPKSNLSQKYIFIYSKAKATWKDTLTL